MKITFSLNCTERETAKTGLRFVTREASGAYSGEIADGSPFTLPASEAPSDKFDAAAWSECVAEFWAREYARGLYDSINRSENESTDGRHIYVDGEISE